MPNPEAFPYTFASFGGSRHWKIWGAAALIVLAMATGTWMAGQYRIGRLDALLEHYQQPIMDFAQAMDRTRPQSLEAELLQGCKQAQVGSWLQTTDAIEFTDPVAGNRVVIRLDPNKAFIDLNGRELAGCVSDEIENRQFDIGSMTNTWALVLFVIGLGLSGWSWLGWQAWRPRHAASAPSPEAEVAEAEVVEPKQPD